MKHFRNPARSRIRKRETMFELGKYSVTYPKGFEASAAAAGIKPGRDDMAMIYSEKPAAAALVSTTNKVKAAPVLWDQQIIKETMIKRAVVVNAGNANACTGEEGYNNTVRTADEAAKLLGLKPDEVFVSSTGVIGVQLPMDKISGGVRLLAGSLSDTAEAGDAAAHAILTTDLKTKTVSAVFMIGGTEVRIGSMAKGSGMIRPNMATMLSYTVTDADISAELLQEALDQITEDTYNMISVDGDMSTNDTCILMANGMSGAPAITSLDSEDGKVFFEAMKAVQTELAQSIVRDGEGATRMMEVNVYGAESKKDARTLARSVVESSLVKTAIFGADANWGRILCALGYADAAFDQYKAELKISSPGGELLMFENGVPQDFSEDKALQILSEPEIQIDVQVRLGPADATAWGCDLSYEYVKINGEYRS